MNTQNLRAVVRNMVDVAAGGVAVVRGTSYRAVRVGVARVVRAWKRTLACVRGRVNAVDIWLQDHPIGVIISALTLILMAVGFLLKYRLEEVIEFARQFTPLLTILSITVTATRRPRCLMSSPGPQGADPADPRPAPEHTGLLTLPRAARRLSKKP